MCLVEGRKKKITGKLRCGELFVKRILKLIKHRLDNRSVSLIHIASEFTLNARNPYYFIVSSTLSASESLECGCRNLSLVGLQGAPIVKVCNKHFTKLERI